MEKTTIFFFHGGRNSYYLPYSINQAKYSNPENTIVFMGDSSNQAVSKYQIKHVMFQDYFDAATEFEKLYVHMSSNSFYTELKCFQRWISVSEYCQKEGIEGSLVLLDSDALVYTSFDRYIEKYLSNFEMGVCGDYGPAYTIFANANIIKRLSDFIISYYKDKDKLESLSKEFEQLKKINKTWSICDMTLLNHFIIDEKIKKLDMCEIRDNACFDCHIGWADERFPLNSKGIKEVHFKNGLPVCKNTLTNEDVTFLGLHFQGARKEFMYKYYTGNPNDVPPKIQAVARQFIQFAKRRIKIGISKMKK